MDNYEVIGLLGEGSFGRVYKAKQISNSKFVALKVISKRGRSTKELKGLRRECEIQRYLHHPNIIQMLDSFETENEIVVITEFAHKELNIILGKEGYLPEDRVQAIVWDLVSALYYLHSHRVLHRDLKPQNILLDSKNCAKLCDFGFARNMSTGTHVLTSIKGTPLYMAPELIEEKPYDHNADLWSLGCIIYELLVGAPPFCTSSILHLIRLIRYEQIQWPTLISDNCISFLKGLLQKNPSKRLTWPDILGHPFVKGHILIQDDAPSMALTRPLSASTLQAKEQQKKDHSQKSVQNRSKPVTSDSQADGESKASFKNKKAINDSSAICSTNVQDVKNNNGSLEENFANLSVESKAHEELNDRLNTDGTADTESKEQKNSSSTAVETASDRKASKCTFNIHEDSYPIENEEWIVFLQRTIEEVLNGEMASVYQPSLTNILVSPLRNTNTSSKVVKLVANVCCLPFVVRGVTETVLSQVTKTYLEVKLIPNLVYSIKLMMRNKKDCESSSSPSQSSVSPPAIVGYRSINDLSEDDFAAIEHILLLICHLVHLNTKFLTQFCDSVVVLHIYNLMQQFLLAINQRLKIVNDTVAILTQILKRLPENSDIVHTIFTTYAEEEINVVELLRHENAVLRERTCYLLLHLVRQSNKTLESIWDEKVKETLEALVYDSVETVRNAAEIAVEEISSSEFSNKTA